MKRIFIPFLFLFLLIACLSFVACGKGSPESLPATDRFTPTPDEYFRFTLSEDDTYEIAARYQDMPSHTIIPATHEGKPVTAIASRAFEERGSIDKITLPSSIKRIGETVFGDDREHDVTIDYEGTLTQWCEVRRADPSLLSHGDFLLNGKKLEGALSIPDETTSIEAYAFYACEGITSVTIPNSVTKIGASAFYACTKLSSVTLPNTITTIEESTFSGCRSLSAFVIPDSVTQIKKYAFADCINLSRLTIGQGVTVIESVGQLDDTFSACYKLVEVYNRSSLPIEKGGWNYGNVAAYAKEIYHDDYVSKLHVDENGYLLYIDEELISLIGYSGDQKRLLLPATVTEIHDGAFFQRDDLTEIICPEQTKTIGTHAFENCSALSTVTFPNGLEEIGAYAFRSCASLAEVTIPACVERVGQAAFSFCTSLSCATIKEGVRILEAEAFFYTALSAITIPNSVTSIGSHAFSLCFALETAVLGQGITQVEKYTFDQTTARTIRLPATLTAIEESALGACSEFFYDGNVEEWSIIQKDPRWTSVRECTIHCADDDITISLR